MGGDVLPSAELDQLADLLHSAVPGKLALGLGPGLFGRLPAGEFAEAGGVAGDLSCDAEANAAATHLWQAYSVVAAIREVFHADLTTAYVDQGLAGITIPLESVHREVEVSVEDE